MLHDFEFEIFLNGAIECFLNHATRLNCRSPRRALARRGIAYLAARTSFRYGSGNHVVELRIHWLAKNIRLTRKRKNSSIFWSRVRHSTSTRSDATASFPNVKFKLQYLPDFFSGLLDPWFQSILKHFNYKCLKYQGVRWNSEVLPMNFVNRPKAEVDLVVLVRHGGE